MFILIFFFSSRRRHTRFSRDWSSDVCSSDLRRPTPTARGSRSAQASRAQSFPGALLGGNRISVLALLGIFYVRLHVLPSQAGKPLCDLKQPRKNITGLLAERLNVRIGKQAFTLLVHERLREKSSAEIPEPLRRRLPVRTDHGCFKRVPFRTGQSPNTDAAAPLGNFHILVRPVLRGKNLVFSEQHNASLFELRCRS